MLTIQSLVIKLYIITTSYVNYSPINSGMLCVTCNVSLWRRVLLRNAVCV